MKTIRVLLADDHVLVRAGIRVLVQGLQDCEVVGEAGTGREALRAIESLKPDIVLMDIMMPELNGLDATARVVASHSGTRVIILSMNADEMYVRQALRAGAYGYLLKNVSPSELELAIRAVARGDTYLSSSVSKHIISGFVQGKKVRNSESGELTPRQTEVLQLVAEGHSTKQIALKLFISVKTVETHRMQLMNTLDIHDIAGLVRYAIRTGLITPDA